MTNEIILRDAKKALNGLVSEGIILGEPKTDFEKRVDDLLRKFEHSPRTITSKELVEVVMCTDSQIQDRATFLAHCLCVGRIFKSAVLLLQKKYNDDLDLPHPCNAQAYGLIHDLSSIFSNWERGRQHSKELDLWMIAKARGIETLANEVAMHSGYFGIAKIMVEGRPFSQKEAYTGMIKVFRGDGPLSYQTMIKEFSGFLAGRDNLPLLLLNAIDHIDVGQREFDPNVIDANFEQRFIKGSFVTYTTSGSLENMRPLGQAFLSGERERLKRDLEIVKNLALGNTEEMRGLYADTTFFKS